MVHARVSWVAQIGNIAVRSSSSGLQTRLQDFIIVILDRETWHVCLFQPMLAQQLFHLGVSTPDSSETWYEKE